MQIPDKWLWDTCGCSHGGLHHNYTQRNANIVIHMHSICVYNYCTHLFQWSNFTSLRLSARALQRLAKTIKMWCLTLASLNNPNSPFLPEYSTSRGQQHQPRRLCCYLYLFRKRFGVAWSVCAPWTVVSMTITTSLINSGSWQISTKYTKPRPMAAQGLFAANVSCWKLMIQYFEPMKILWNEKKMKKPF